MRSDFAELKAELSAAGIGILDICRSLYMDPVKRGSRWWVKSPCNKDSYPSLALWPDTNAFTDFSNGNYGGDMIGFVAYVKGINAWQAMGVLREHYRLSTALTDTQDRCRMIDQERTRQRKEQRAEEARKIAWVREVERLKGLERRILEVIQLSQPLDDVWCGLTNRLQYVRYRLDQLCGID